MAKCPWLFTEKFSHIPYQIRTFWDRTHGRNLGYHKDELGEYVFENKSGDLLFKQLMGFDAVFFYDQVAIDEKIYLRKLGQQKIF